MRTVTKTIDINAHITNITCEVSVDNGLSKATVSFDTLGFGIVTAVKFDAKGFNSFGDVVQIGGKDEFFLIIQDIYIEKNASAKNLIAKLPNSDIRRLELVECQICYADGSVSSYAGTDNRSFEIQYFNTFGDEKETLDAVRDIISPEAECIPQDTDFGWLCSCGRFNTNGNNICSKCGTRKEEIFRITNSAIISGIIAEHKRKEADRLEREHQATRAKEKAKKRRHIKIGIGAIIGIMLVVFVGYTGVMANRSIYSSESDMKMALQGTYTCYEGYKPKYQILIDDDTFYKRWCSLGSDYDMELDVKAWNYKKGTVDLSASRYFVVTKTGELKYDDDIYKKGGSWSETASGSSVSSNYESSQSSSGSSYSSRYNYEDGSSVLKITADSLKSNTSYKICTGSVKNTGTKTYKFIEVKGAFKDSNGNVIDTAWSYAVGSEGLAPGESSTFRISVDNNPKITSCSVSLLDYD